MAKERKSQCKNPLNGIWWNIHHEGTDLHNKTSVKNNNSGRSEPSIYGNHVRDASAVLKATAYPWKSGVKTPTAPWSTSTFTKKLTHVWNHVWNYAWKSVTLNHSPSKSHGTFDIQDSSDNLFWASPTSEFRRLPAVGWCLPLPLCLKYCVLSIVLLEHTSATLLY